MTASSMATPACVTIAACADSITANPQRIGQRIAM